VWGRWVSHLPCIFIKKDNIMLTATEISIILMLIERYDNIDSEWDNTIKEIKRKLETMQMASSEG